MTSIPTLSSISSIHSDHVSNSILSQAHTLDVTTIDSIFSFSSVNSEMNRKKINFSYFMTDSFLSLIPSQKRRLTIFALQSNTKNLKVILETTLDLNLDHSDDDDDLSLSYSDSPVIMHAHLDNSNIIGIVLKNVKNILILYDFAYNRDLMSMEFNDSISNIHLHKDFFIVQFEDIFHIYDNTKQKTFEHSINLNCKLELYQDILVYPFKNDIIYIKDFSKNVKESFNSHNNFVKACCVDSKRSLIATTSSKGTNIKVFKLENNKLHNEFTRGNTRADIYCIRFSKSSKFVAASSSGGTLHIWEVEQQSKWFSNRSSSQIKNLDVPNIFYFDENEEDLIHVFAHDSGKYYSIKIENKNATIINELVLYSMDK